MISFGPVGPKASREQVQAATHCRTTAAGGVGFLQSESATVFGAERRQSERTSVVFGRSTAQITESCVIWRWHLCDVFNTHSTCLGLPIQVQADLTPGTQQLSQSGMQIPSDFVSLFPPEMSSPTILPSFFVACCSTFPRWQGAYAAHASVVVIAVQCALSQL